MSQTIVKPLKPLSHGNILIVGVKASNFDEELKNHPRIVLWESQQQSWTDKELPQNTQAVFVTRFIGHNNFGKILTEARKKKITMFNPEGTGMIVRQVKELLALNESKTEVTPMIPSIPSIPSDYRKKGKLKPLIPYIDFSQNDAEAGRLLMTKAQELGISTTLLSLKQLVRLQRRKQNLPVPLHTKTKGHADKPKRTHKHVDVVVEILDNMVKELQDMREYLVATTDENKSLKTRIEILRKTLG